MGDLVVRVGKLIASSNRPILKPLADLPALEFSGLERCLDPILDGAPGGIEKCRHLVYCLGFGWRGVVQLK
jgi:hypothetical protein